MLMVPDSKIYGNSLSKKIPLFLDSYILLAIDEMLPCFSTVTIFRVNVVVVLPKKLPWRPLKFFFISSSLCSGNSVRMT